MSTHLLDELDQLLEEYLTLLDSYQTLHNSLESSLKQGHFNLAKSKLALGPQRLSKDSWDLKEKQSSVEILIQLDEGDDDTRTTTTRETKQQSKSDLTFSLQPRSLPSPPPASSDPDSSASASGLRRRTTTTTPSQPAPTTTTSSSPSSDQSSSAKPQSSPSDASTPPALQSPLSQFSAFPPPPLRAASKDFDRVLEETVKIVGIERRLRGLGREIKGVKKRIRQSEIKDREGGGRKEEQTIGGAWNEDL
ncbi:uncharacterized protein JCM6883_003108 [Sporobolomyces salmoneus]|uniref:uncharacterized protein n=1 Tax=Sporobolomyces salmoneus TaxID=183962 RepID=UPI00318010FE